MKEQLEAQAETFADAANQDKAMKGMKPTSDPVRETTLERFKIGRPVSDEFVAIYSYDPDEDWTLDFDAVREFSGTDNELVRYADVEPVIRLREKVEALSALWRQRAADIGDRRIVDNLADSYEMRADELDALLPAEKGT